MSEAGDYSPGVWSGHNFDSARASYRTYAKSSYSKAVNRGVAAKDLVPKSLSTKSANPVVIIVDETGSMGEWPATMFSKLPYLEHEAKTEYMGKDVEVSWAAIGDVPNGETYPLQVRQFTSGTDLAEKMKELIIEGKGGGTHQESYELAALYYARNVKMPNAIRPLLIFIGDESPYDFVDPDEAKSIACVDLTQKLSRAEVFEELKRCFSVYFVQKPYGDERLTDGPLTGITRRVHEDWVALVDEDHVALLGDPSRVVDVIFGIMAREAGKIPYFQKEIEERQNPNQIKTVYTALRTVHALPGGKDSRLRLGSGHSVLTQRPQKGGRR